MDDKAYRRGRLAGRAGAALALIVASEILIDGSIPGAVVGGFAFAWLAMMALVRPAVLRGTAARWAVIAAAVFVLALVDDPGLLSWAMFWVALSLAALLPRRGFDDALMWGRRLLWHALAGAWSPWRDVARIAVIRQRRAPEAGGVRGAARMLALPVVGGAIFIALFASANPLIGEMFARIVLPDFWTVIWRGSLAVIVLMAVWASLRPGARSTILGRDADRVTTGAFDPGARSLILSLVTFNAIFAVENLLDVVFLWSGAALPAGVAMRDYVHQGAYSLIVTALLAGLFVLVALRPGSVGAAHRSIRRLVIMWIAQNLLLVASSALRTLDYVDAYGMTVLRLAALAWMVLVATGLALIGWRLAKGRSAAWLINANALAATLMLTIACFVDLGSAAADWNRWTAMAGGGTGRPVDLCYMAELGPSAAVSLARLERATRQPVLRDRLAFLRLNAQTDLVDAQGNWRSWTPRNARRLSEIVAIVGPGRPVLRDAPDGRGCDGSIFPPTAVVEPSLAPTPLTRGPQR